MLRLPAIRNRKNFASGLLYIGAGLAFAAGATSYNLGSAERMGPGYFPFAVLVALVALPAISKTRETAFQES